MEQEPIVSIVVPIYNAGRFLWDSLKSIWRQSFQNWEAILVDDGSTDRSVGICDQIASEEPRFRVIHQQNGGVSRARNAGIEASRGKYLMFIDADDLVERTYLQSMVNALEKNRVDLAVCGYERFRGDWTEPHPYVRYSTVVMRDIREFLMAFTEAKTNLFGVAIWGKLYRADIIRKYKLRFDPEISYEEDCDFNVRYFARASSAVALGDVLYRYRQSDESLSKAYRKDTFRFLVNGFQKRCALMQSMGLDEYRPSLEAILLLVIKSTCLKIQKSDLSRAEQLEEYRKIVAFPEAQQAARYPKNKRPNSGVTRAVAFALRRKSARMLRAVMDGWKLADGLLDRIHNLKYRIKYGDKTKKVGIITFHFPFNCGAALQCFALENTIESFGNKVRIINYCPWYHQNRYSSYKNPFYYANKKLHEPAPNVFARIKNALQGFRDTVKSWKGAKERLVREQKFNAFRKAHLNETRMYRSLKGLRLFPPRAKLYIAGSDQLWNSKLTDQKFDPAYFLNFGPKKTMRITYAVGSYFADPAAAKAEIAPLLKKVNCISLREKKFLNDVKDAAYRNMRIHIDVDPTLLLDASAYDALLPKEPLEKDPYIVVYSMPGPAQKQVNEAAKAIAEKTGLHLIDVNGNPNAGNRQIEDQRICSPGEFLWYIKNATYVVTNSFHGTVFSVLYEKRFAVILHKETGNRVSELLESLGLATYCTGKTEAVEPILNRPINWKNVKSKLWRLREDSLDYLRYWCIGGPRPEFVTDRKEPEKPAAQPAPQKAAPKPADKPAEPQKPQPERAAVASASVSREQTVSPAPNAPMYTDDKNAQIVLALLKKYNIRKIVVSPGTTNVPIARGVQFDPFFEVYSAVDERGAAYLAGGLAFASGEPVVLSCTGATASRDYIPGLTEAYYRNLPVIAITSQHHSPMYTDLMPQMTDRTVSQNDVKRFAAILPLIKDAEDWRACVQLVNEAFYTATRPDAGPVHINLPVGNLYSFKTPALPDVQKIDVHDAESFPTDALKAALRGKKVALFIGSHKPFDPKTLAAIEAFAASAHAPVFCDHTANYTGKNCVLSEVAGDLNHLKALPELVIDLGSVSGDYSASPLFRGLHVWRISEDRKFHNRHGAEIVEKQFFCSERFFFEALQGAETGTNYAETVRVAVPDAKLPELPLSNLYAASQLAQRIPNGSYLHLGILNSLRSMNYFRLDPSITVSCNVGGFGIDGALSTALGQSLADRNRLSFCLLGDLAFFYDMNALGNRHLGSNLRILLINNARGVEFRLNASLERLWGADTDDLIAAHGHFGSAKGWAESMGVTYLSAQTKEQFDKAIEDLCDPDVNRFPRSVVLEVFTGAEEEQTALKRIRDFNRPTEGQL